MLLGHKLLGSGTTKLLIMHDWFSDASEYESAMRYVDPQKYTICLTDLRGYGRSKHIEGAYTLEETVTDVLHLMDHLGWEQCNVLGHSMSALTAQYLAVQQPNRIQSLMLVTPVLPSGLAMEGDMMHFIENVGGSDDESARQSVNYMTGSQHSEYFCRLKVKSWREASLEAARLGYLKMFTQASFVSQAKAINQPICILLSKHDAEYVQEEAFRPDAERIYPSAKYVIFSEAGHYPMMEMPVAFADAIDNFLSRASVSKPVYGYEVGD